MAPVKETTRFTVDLDQDTHQALTDLAEYQGRSKAELVRGAIAQLQLASLGEIPLPGVDLIRFTVDLSLDFHQKLSMLAVWQRCKKADLVRLAIAHLLEYMIEGQLGKR